MLLEIAGLTKGFGWGQRARAIDGVEFSLDRGEVVGLVGLNGAGKSTTLRIVAGAALADTGTVRIDGHDNRAEKAEASRCVGWVPELPAHEPDARLDELVGYYASFGGGLSADRADGLFTRWGLATLRRRRFRTLSMGQKKRFALAVSEIQDPSLFLLDEVFNGIDPEGAGAVRAWILDRRRAGCGLLVSSHILRELRDLSDRIVVIHEGRVRAQIRSDAIPKPRGVRIRIGLDRVDPAALQIAAGFGGAEQVGSMLVVAGDEINPGRLTVALVTAGYSVERIETEDHDLEKYFLGLIRSGS